MSKKLIILSVFILSISFAGLVSAEEPADNENRPQTEQTVQTDTDKQTAKDSEEKDCCKENHQQHNQEQTK